MRIEIRLTQRCNFSCWYCTDLHDNATKHTAFNFNGFEKLLNRVDDPSVFIYGGEPTLHPELKSLTEFLLNRGITTTVQSNGSNKKVLRLLDKRIKLNYSYHSKTLSLSQFLRNISGTNVNEIAFMSDGEDHEYILLKRLYKNKVQYCPLINSELDNHEENVELKTITNKGIFDLMRDDYHFREHENGISNYHTWFNDIDSLGVKCRVKQTTLHVQDNKVYFCFNALMKDQDGMPFEQFELTTELITCPFKRCYFGMENWIIDHD